MIEDATPAELAILELRRCVDVGLATTDGQLGLLHQLQTQLDRRADEHGRLIQELDDRLTRVERDQVTRTQLDTRYRHTVALLSLLAAAASVACTAVIALLGG